MGIAESINSATSNLIEIVSGDTSDICREAAESSVDDWKSLQIIKASAIGAGAAAIPIFSYLTLPADILTTLRIMHRAATGICYIRLRCADDETFAGVLGVWSGAVSLDNSLATQIAAKSLAAGGSAIGGTVGLKLAIKGFNLCTSVIVAEKLGPKVAQKVAAKLTTKLAAKATTRWIPVISALVGGGTNWWLVDGIAQAAEEYCDFIARHGPPLLPT